MGYSINITDPVRQLPPPPLNQPLKTCLFFEGGNSWSFFSAKYDAAKRDRCLNSIKAGGGNSIISLLSNMDPDAPVSFWKDGWGGAVDMEGLNLLEQEAQRIAAAGGSLWPCFFCDEDENRVIRDAPMLVHQRAFSLLIAHLRPYVPGFCIGLESSEWADRARHNELAELIKYLAPDRYVVSHMQSVPRGGVPELLDAIFFEHGWPPDQGNAHSPEEVVAEAQSAKDVFHKIVVPVEYNLDFKGTRIREQSRALLAAGFGCGGPI